MHQKFDRLGEPALSVVAAAPPRALPGTSPFRSFFWGGFECSTHRRADGRRLDLLAATEHDRTAAMDYRLLGRNGIRTVRDGFRWHLIEAVPGVYDWSSAEPMLSAARACGTQVVWDLCHYGWPDHLDIWSPAFVERFADFALAAARTAAEAGGEAPLLCLINELSYWAWAGGEVGRFWPARIGHGNALKSQLVRAAVAAARRIRAALPEARFITAEPAIHVHHTEPDSESGRAAALYHDAQFTALDMVLGRSEPELGGEEGLVDIVGINVYPDNQWAFGGGTIPLGHHHYRPLRQTLAEVHRRYGRPIVISETGAEGSARASWLHYVCAETRAALRAGIPIWGLCLYPILDYPGWENDRHCEVGLLSRCDGEGHRRTDRDLADELAHQQQRFCSLGDERDALAS